jgi:hypothetical protein
LSLIACGQEADDPSESPRGSLTLALTAVDSGGVQYRLRNAEFQVTGYPDGYPYYPPYVVDDDGGMSAGGRGGSGGYPGYVDITLSSETDPEAAVITKRLVPGSYNVFLSNSDWYLERTTEDGTERVEQAVLLSSPYQYVYVYDGGVTQVNYRFGVDGELIDFRSGELQIGIEIEKPGEHCPGGYGGYGGYYGYAGFGGPGRMYPNCGSAGSGMPGGVAGAGAPIP